MKRILWIALSVTVIAGCGTDYRRELSAESLSEHRFVRVEFEQAGWEKVFPVRGIDWGQVDGFTLIADDGWRLIILGPGHPGYNRALDDQNDEPIRFQPGRGDRMWLNSRP